MATCRASTRREPRRGQRSAITYPNNNYALNANVTIPVSDFLFRLEDANAVAARNRDSANYALEAERLKVRADARVLYFNWLRTHGQVSIAEQAVQQTQARLRKPRQRSISASCRARTCSRSRRSWPTQSAP